jgi:hypothetical protein
MELKLMLYRPDPGNANGTTVRDTIRVAPPRREISGHKLARMLAGKTKAQRALILEDLHRRGFTLIKPTVKQLAAIGDISAAMVHAAQKLDHVERVEVKDGLRHLMEKPAKPSPFSAEVSDRWGVAKELVEKFGPATVFDTIICPKLA